MPSKYDTNPLDPDFPEKVRRESAGTPTHVLTEMGAQQTQNFGRPVRTEDETTRLNGGQQYAPPPPPPFSQPYTGQYVPAGYQQQTFGSPRDRKVEPFGMPEGLVTAVPYIPWYIGMVAAAIILYLTPRSETKVRFYAAQGLAAHLGIFIFSGILGAIGQVSGAARVGNVAFILATSIILIIFAIKAWKGKPVHIEAIDPLTNWLEDKIHKKDA